MFYTLYNCHHFTRFEFWGSVNFIFLTQKHKFILKYSIDVTILDMILKFKPYLDAILKTFNKYFPYFLDSIISFFIWIYRVISSSSSYITSFLRILIHRKIIIILYTFMYTILSSILSPKTYKIKP